MRSIGIVGGMGHVATVHFYGMLLRRCQRAGARRNADYPAIFVHGIADVDNVESLLDADLPMRLQQAMRCLSDAGADVLCIPCNTVHNLVPGLDLHGLELIDAVATTVVHVTAAAPARVLLLATQRTLRNELYTRPLLHHGIEVVTPEPAEQLALGDLILDVNAGMPPDTLAEPLLSIVAATGQRADMVLLGCTELSLIQPFIADRLPHTIDSLASLADAVYRASAPV